MGLEAPKAGSPIMQSAIRPVPNAAATVPIGGSKLAQAAFLACVFFEIPRQKPQLRSVSYLKHCQKALKAPCKGSEDKGIPHRVDGYVSYVDSMRRSTWFLCQVLVCTRQRARYMLGT